MLHNFLQNWFHLFMQLKEGLIIVVAYKQKEIIKKIQEYTNHHKINCYPQIANMSI